MSGYCSHQSSHVVKSGARRFSNWTNPVVRYLAVLLVFFVLVGAATDARAELASTNEMQQVCQNWLTTIVSEEGAWAGDSEPQILAAHGIYSRDTLLATWYDISPQGFVIVPVLKEMQPVKAYSDEYDLNAAQDGGFLDMLREMLVQRMRYYASQAGSLDAAQSAAEPVFDPEQRTKWDRYTLNTKEFAQILTTTAQQAVSEAGPLLTTSWHQSAPYNNLCPMGDGGRTVVGCVATAAAQIMNYWQWPEEGFGSHSYTWGGDYSCGGSTAPKVLTVDFSDSYDWANMIDSCDGGCTPAEAAALADLSYEVGVAFDMDYGACGSGSYVSLAAQVFPEFFKYSDEIELHYRADYDIPGWFALMQTEIDAGRPIDYRISQHSIVLDGYRTDGFSYEYHMNYGWGGSFTTWFVLDNLYCYWEPGDLCPASVEMMVTNIKPQTKPVLSMVGQTIDDSAGNNNVCADIGETVQLTMSIRNKGVTANNVLGHLSTDDPYVSVGTADAPFADSLPWGGEAQTQTPFVFSVAPGCPDPHIAIMVLTVTADGGYVMSDTSYQFIGSTRGFADDFESGRGFWTHSSPNSQYTDEWHLETSRVHGGTSSWKAGGDGNNYYRDNSDGRLVTPPFLLPGNAILTFWHWINAEQGDDAGTAWDGGVVYISSGDGQWTPITPTGGYPYTIIDNPASPFDPGTPCYSGSHDWSQAEFDLAGYSGVVQLMFRFGTDGAVTKEGWYVDDVSVERGGCCGIYTGGLTGNTDCSTDGMSTLNDITTLIDRVYISHNPLCCEENGNLDGSADGELTLADITTLIDLVYVTHNPPVACQ